MDTEDVRGFEQFLIQLYRQQIEPRERASPNHFQREDFPYRTLRLTQALRLLSFAETVSDERRVVSL